MCLGRSSFSCGLVAPFVLLCLGQVFGGHWVVQILGFGFFQKWVRRHPVGVLKQDFRAITKAHASSVDHPWPSGRGIPKHYGVSVHPAPSALTQATLAWSWHHPKHRFGTITYGTVIDDENNIYLSSADGLRKFSPDGKVLWEYSTLPAESVNAPFLLNGAIYNTDTWGNVFALGLERGELLWSVRIAEECAQDNGFVTATEGVLVIPCDGDRMEFNRKVIGLNATDGTSLWSFEPDVPVWNFMASFPGDGTFVFQDKEGKAYRCSLHDGQLIWKRGGFAGSWCDGTATLGSNNVLYAVMNYKDPREFRPDHKGMIRAYRISDGELLWQRETPKPANNAPAVGMLHGLKRLSVVLPEGQQGARGMQTALVAFDAETGDQQWVFNGPIQMGDMQAGDAEGIHVRMFFGVRAMCLPNGWSAPTIDSKGDVLVGNQEGQLFAIRDSNGDGTILGSEEVRSSFDTGACFAGSMSPAIVNGMLAVATCDSLFVFKQPEA